MRVFRAWMLLAVAGILCFAGQKAFAHGSHSLSLQTLADHIDEHIVLLESLVGGPSFNPDYLREQFGQVQRHAGKYQILAKKLVREKQEILTGRALSRISEALIVAAQNQDVIQSIEILKKIKILVQPTP